MSVDIKKRFDRIVDILIQLQSRRIVRAQDLANRFEVSLRTIYRDIKSLEQAGVPLVGEAGSGYSLMDGYRLPPISFTKEEALSFVAAEKISEKFLDKEIGKQFNSAMIKIKAVLKSHDQDLLTNVEDQIVMRKQNVPIFLDKVSSVLSNTLEAIAHKKQIQIVYQGIKDDNGKVRTLEPIGVVHETGFWYIIAYCISRKDFRQFRSDRIQEINRTEIPFSKEHISVEEYLKSIEKPSPVRIPIRILIDKEFAAHMRWQRNHYGFTKEIAHNDQIEMHFEVIDIEHEFPRWLLMFGDRIKVIEPQSLTTNIKNLIQEYHNNFLEK